VHTWQQAAKENKGKDKQREKKSERVEMERWRAII